MTSATQSQDTAMNAEDRLARLREPFPDHQISKLPKPTKPQTEAVKADYKKGHRCKLCGSWHHPDVVHLDYVGHAALTDRLLDTDPAWSWEPVAFRDGLPAFDASGGLWIKLTVCGVTRLGYGHAASKPGVDPGAREKEVIGDALRNAAMRFGAALDLWHKGDLHLSDEASDEGKAQNDDRRDVGNPKLDFAIAQMRTASTGAAFADFWKKNKDALRSQLTEDEWTTLLRAKDVEVARITKAQSEDAATERPAETPFDEAA